MDRENPIKSTGYKIICKNYPSEFILDKTIAKEYFRQYGKMKRVTFKPKVKVCTIEYVDKESIIKAMTHGGHFNGHYFEITAEGLDDPSKKKASSSNPIWLDKDEIEAELEAMSGNASRKYFAPPLIDLTDSLSELPKPEKNLKLKRVWKTETATKPKKKMRSVEKFSSLLSSDQVELVNLMLSQVSTAEEKFRVLDARDKLIRAKLKKNTQLKSKATVGTCPDMCPEKERLMRETQHQVALYEQEENGKSMDQQKAVKQYSRSSADQEAPLPHELRPVSVLQMTICYLMHNIMGLCDTDDVNLAEWYHFLWDRTRGIRKDITQQELCCQGAVELVEQCARFHIHCSARLVAEDPSVFDQKINTENLTKCLQTLKYMYHDLHVKGEICPNEAEFRAYIILLNLNDGNFMWEVQEWQQEIQKSKEVKFALEVYSALDKNNYVKFFYLVRDTTYLNACILMRYFVQVRITAIKTLLKCYSPRALKTVYPLSELVQILAFDDIDSGIDFMQSYGISINEEKSHIVIEKNIFALPELPYIMERSLVVVESKRNFSLGKIICGKDLPPKIYETHIPQQSFDSSGYLVTKDILEEDDLEQAKLKLLADLEDESDNIQKVPPLHVKVPERVAGPSIFAQKSQESKVTVFGNQFLKKEPVVSTKESTSIFSKQSNIFQKSIFGNTASQDSSSNIWKRDAAQTTDQTDGTIWPAPSTSSILFKPVESGTIFEQRVFGVPTNIEDSNFAPDTKKGGFKFDLKVTKRHVIPAIIEPPKEIPKPEQLVETFQSNLAEEAKRLEDLRKKREEEIARKKLEETKRREQMLLKQKREEEQKLKLLKQKIIEDQLKKHMEELEREDQLMKEKEQQQTIREVVDFLITEVDQNERTEKLTAIRKRITDKLVLKLFKKWYTIVSINRRKRKVVECSPLWVNTKTLKQSAEELHTSSQDLTLALIKRYKYGKPLDIGNISDDKIEKINLFELTHATLSKRFYNLTGKLQKNIFWKVVVSLPGEDELLNGLNRMQETLSDAFQWKEKNGTCILVEQVKPNVASWVTYCLEMQKGLDVRQSDANGIIFIAKDFNPMLQHRIFEHLKNFGVFTKVPIVILLQHYDENKCNFKTLIEEKIVSDYVILVENLSPYSLVNIVEEGLVFLASKVEKPPPLELDTLHSFLVKHLCTEIWRRANSFAKWNSHYKTCLRNPNIIITLYNEALSKLSRVIMNKSCKEYATFPDVFKDYLRSEVPDFVPCNYYYFPSFWRSEIYLHKLESILKQLSLPKFQDQWPPNNEFELEVSISNYCTKIFKAPEKPFYRAMSVLLRNVDPKSNFEDINKVLWTDVIELLGLEKLRQTELSLNNTEFANKSIYNQYIVIYDVDTLDHYNNSDWFYVNNPVIKKYIKRYLTAAKKTVPEKPKQDLNLSIDLDKTIAAVKNQTPDSLERISLMKELDNFNALLDDLDTSIKITKKVSSRFEEELKKAINDK